MAAPRETSSEAVTSVPLVQEDTKPTYACVSCSARKVKCDRLQPCGSCTRSRLARCEYRAPAPPQRRKRKAGDVDGAVIKQLRHYEDLLKSKGLLADTFKIELDSPESQRTPTSIGNDRSEEPFAKNSTDEPGRASAKQFPLPLTNSDGGTLVDDENGQRYYEHKLLANLSREFRKDPVDVHQYPNQEYGDMQQQPSGTALATGLVMGVALPQPSSPDQPGKSTIMTLWSIFLDRINPLTKVFHAPTVQNMLVDAIAHPSQRSKSTEILMFSLYACAVLSMNDAETKDMFHGRSQSLMLSIYQTKVQNLLLESEFLRSSDLTLLQAYALFLTSLQDCHPRSFWILVGVAMRIGQTLGLHRDGAALGIRPFETEMRRRLWWYLVTLDVRATELAGAGMSAMPLRNDTRMPLNADDRDIDPEAQMLPQARIGPSEMTYCLLRYESSRYLLEMRGIVKALGSELLEEESGDSAFASKSRDIPDFENFLESRFLRFCDPVIPLHILTTVTARSTICKVKHHRLMHKYVKEGLEKFRKMDLSDRDLVLTYSLKSLEYENFLQSTRSTSRYRWYTKHHFPWGILISLLYELSGRKECGRVLDTAWDLLEEFFDHHPEYGDTRKKSIFMIIGELTLKAWAARESAMEVAGSRAPRVPLFIQRLRTSRVPTMQANNALSAFSVPSNQGTVGGQPDLSDHNLDFTSLFSYDAYNNSVDVLNWGNLLADLEQ